MQDSGDLRNAPTAANYHTVGCPNCGDDDATHLYQLQISAIVTCRNCGLSYVNPRVTSAEINRKLQLWATEDVVDGERLRHSFEPATLAYYGRFIALVERRVRRGRLLDIGCSTGAFLQVARAAGWQVEGLEIGLASARYAAESLGLSVQQGSLYDYVPSEKFDALAMLEVIEHLEDPRRALGLAHELLTDDGVLLVTTPNFDSLYRRLCGPRWWVINCEDEHIVLFTLAALTRLLEDAGFVVVDYRIRSIDWLGLLREWRSRGETASKIEAPTTAIDSYYTSRAAKSRVKHWLGRLGILSSARALLHLLDRTFEWRWSPTFAWGEHLVVIARRRTER